MTKQFQNLNQIILDALDTYRDRTCFRVKYDGHYHNISYHRFRALTFRMTHFLRSQGVSNGERVALSAENSLEWMVVHMACLLAGGTVVPLSRLLSPDSLLSILQDSGARAVAVQGSRQYQVLNGAKSLLPSLKTILSVDKIEEDGSDYVQISSILSSALTPEIESDIQEQAEGLTPQTLASIHYTAGETGDSKGATFNQGQRLQAIRQMDEWLIYDEDDLALTILSWGSAASLDFAIHLFVSGVPNILAENEQHVLENMQQTSPTLLQITPYVVEVFYGGIMQEINELPQSSQDIFNWALAISKEYLEAGSNASTELREGYERADMTFFSQLRAKIGGRVRRLYLAKAALPQHLAEFVEAIGLIPLNVYSHTEAGGFPAISRPGFRRHGACGQTAQGFQINIADDGEVLVKGSTVMSQYWQRSQETEQMINADGWLRTGDLGYLDEQGFLYLTGRKESTMVLSTGHKIIPLNIEKVLMSSPFIAQAVVFAEGRPYVSAFIVPELDALSGDFNKVPAAGDESTGSASTVSPELTWYWLHENETDPPMATPAGSDVKSLLDKAIETVNSQLEPWEQIVKYSLLEQAYSQAANNLADMMPAGRQLIIEAIS